MTKTHNSLKINKLYNFSCFFFEEKFTAKLENGAFILKISHKMKKIYAIVMMSLLLLSGLPLQKERNKLKLPKLAKHPIECSWLRSSKPQAKLARATYSRCYAMNGTVRFRQHLEEANRQFLREMLRPQSQPKPSVNFTLSGDTDRLLAETLEPSREDMAMEEAVAGPEMATVEGMRCPQARFEGETDELKVFAAADEGVFPYGTEMRVEPVPSDYAVAAVNGSGSAATDALAADITFWHEGEEVQPQGEVFVQLTAKREIAGDSHHSVTIDDQGNATLIASAASQASIFNTNHFTVYGIVGQTYNDEDVEKYVRHTYIFYVDEVKVDERIVREGDTLTVPVNPAGDAKHVFAGWYKADEEGNLTDEKVESGAVTIIPARESAAEAMSVTAEDKTIKVYAKFDTQYLITLYTDEDKSLIFNTITATDEETVNIPSPETAPVQGLIVPHGEKITGWRYAENGGETVTGNSVTINGADIELVPVFAASHNVKFELVKDIFDAIPEQNVLDGDKVEKPTQYVVGNAYKGYEFGGWYTEYDPEEEDPDEAFSEAFNFDEALEEDDGDLTLYAKWLPAEVDYTIEVWLESAHAHEEPFQLYASVMRTGTSEKEVPVSEILNTYSNDKYKSGTPGYFHWSGTGALNGSEERTVVEVESSGTGTVEYDKNGNPAGTDAAVINPDGSTVVRIYYCRDTYRINFLFAGKGDDSSIVSSNKRYDGVYVSQTLSDSGKKLVPEGVPGDVTLPVINAKYGEWLYECTHITNTTHADVFDAFIDDPRWYFQRLDFNGSGETVFNHTNTQSPVKPNKVTKDGGDLYVLLYIKNQQKEYVYQYLYYNEAYTQEDIRNGSADDPRKGDVVKIFYAADGDHGHAHSFEIGKSDGGYKLVDISGQYGVKLNGNGGIRTDNPVLNDGTHKFYWVNGEYNNSEDVEWIYLHMVPKAYTITFKQTKNAGYVNGEKISADSKKSDVIIENVFYGSDIADILNDERVPAWNELTDDRGVVYSRIGDWLGDDIAEGGGFPNTMPDHNMVFYLDWTAGTYTVTYDPGYEGGKVVEKYNLAWGVRVPDPADYGYDKREGWTLLGWEAYELDRDDDGNRVQGQRIGDGYFTFNTPVKQDLYLKAVWAKPGGYQVVYQNGAHGKINGEDTVTDPMTYDSNSKAPVKYTATPEEGWVFIGWAIGETLPKSSIDGTPVYYGSGDVIHYSEDADLADGTEDSIITLVAQYEYTMGNRVDVTYHTNFPGGSGQPDRDITLPGVAPWNGDFTILRPNATELGFPEAFEVGYYRYEFMGWTTTSEEKIFSDNPYYEYFYADEIVAAGKEDNHLYATWRVIELHIEVPVTKVWDDNDNQDGIRTDAVTVRVLENGTEVERATLSADNDWHYIFQNLYSNRNYIVEEMTVPEHYEVTVTGNLVSGYTVTNTHTPFETSVSVSKVWDDAENRDGIRPDAARVLLYADGTAHGDTITLNAGNSWAYTWDGLPQRRNGTDIAYTVKEVSVPTDYTVSYAGDAATGYTVTNKHFSPVTVNLDVQKQLVGRNWFNEDLFYIELDAEDETFPMPEDASAVAEDFIVKDIVIRNNSDTVAPDTRGAAFPPITFTLDDLGGETSKTFTYYLNEETPEEERREDRIPGIFYDGTIFTIDITVSQGANDSLHADISIYGKPGRDSLVTTPVFVNRYSESEFLYTPVAEKSLVHVSTPAIQDGEFQFELRPVGANAAVAPMPASSGGEGSNRADTAANVGHHVNFGIIAFNHNNLRTAGFTDKQLIDGVSFHYQMREILPEGTTNLNNGTHSLKNGDVTTYYDAVVHFRELVVHMDTTEGKHQILLDTINTLLFPEYYLDTDGNQVVVDRASEAGLLRHRAKVPLFCNVRIADTAVAVTKVWKDYNDGLALRPANVKVKLWADGVAKDSVLLTEGNDWAHTFSGLPFAKVNSQLGADTIRYTVTENAVADYFTDIEDTDSHHYTVTNTLDSNLLKKDTSITVQKRWICPAGTTHPDITVLLLRDGEQYDSVVLHHGETTHTFTGLPFYDVYDESGKVVVGTEDLRPFVYTTAERPVSGYTTVVSPTYDTITNTIAQEYTSVPGRKRWVDSTGTHHPDITIVLLRDGEAIDSVMLPHGTVLFHFQHLPVYDVLTATGDTIVSGDGHVFAYSVIERPVEGYSTEQEGYNFTNTIDQAYFDIPVTKVWDDAHDQDGYRPQNVTLRLTGTTPLPYEQTYEMVITGEGDRWDSVFKDLPVYDDARNVIRYALSEPQTPEHYTQSVTGYTVTNTHEPETVDLTVYKHWKDNHNAQLLRDYVRLELRNNLGSEVIRTNYIPTLDDYGHYTWMHMPKYHNHGQLVEYYVTETPVPEQYRESYAHGGRLVEANGYVDTITNEHLIPVAVLPEVIKVLRGRQWFQDDWFAFALEPATENIPMPEIEDAAYNDILPFHIFINDYSTVLSDSSKSGTFIPIVFTMDDLGHKTDTTFRYILRELAPEYFGEDNIPGVTYTAKRFHMDITLSEGAHDSLKTVVTYYSITTHNEEEVIDSVVRIPMFVNTFSNDSVLYHPRAEKRLEHPNAPALSNHEFTFELKPVGQNAAFAPMPRNTVGEGINRTLTVHNIGGNVRFFEDNSDGLLFSYTTLREHGFTDKQLIDTVYFEYQMREVIPAGAVNNNDGTYSLREGNIEHVYDALVHFRQFNIHLDTVGGDLKLKRDHVDDPIHTEYYLKDNGDTVFVPRGSSFSYPRHENDIPVFCNFRIIDTTVTVTKQWIDYNNTLGTRPVSVTVELRADNEVIATAQLSQGNNWTHTFTGLPLAQISNGSWLRYIYYTVTELPVANHAGTVSRTDSYHYTVTNQLTTYSNDLECGSPVEFDQLSPCTEAECPATVTADGNTYTAAKIDGYCWMTENLRTPAPNAMIYRSTLSNNLQINFQTYGYLYTWHDAAGGTDTPERVNGYVRGICPEGWHLPTVKEINVLRTHRAENLSSENLWVNHFGTNASGFNAHPAGFYNATLNRFEGLYSETWFHGDTSSSAFGLQSHCCTVPFGLQSDQNAFSVRCVKDCE